MLNKIKGKVKQEHKLTQLKKGTIVIPKKMVKELEKIEKKENIKLK